VEVKDDLGVRHKLWQLSRPEFHSWIDSRMRDKKFIIADGHHRYETALEYRRLMRERPEGFKGDCDYVMMFLAPIESKGLTILPFHRLLTLDSPESALEQLRRGFDVAEHPVGPSTADSCREILEHLGKAPQDRPAYVFYPGGEKAFLLTKREDTDLSELLREGTSGQVGELDVTILHQAVIGGLLGLDEQNLVQQGKVTFSPRPEEAFEEARKRPDRPTRIDQVWKIAVSGQKMPQKSTNFYPKLTTGLVINEL
jgi:hypothetical protein